MQPETEKPRDEDIDLCGLTHVGRVRSVNEDNFLLCSLHKTMKVHATSLPDLRRLPLRHDRLGFLAVVADGLGGLARGDVASRRTIELVAQYATVCMDCFYTADPEDEALFLSHLNDAVLHSHRTLFEESKDGPEEQRMATTLTLLMTVWPRLHVVQVGDSRCYVLHDGELTRITRDQTLAQQLVDHGAMTPEEAETSPYAHVLSSAIGAEEAQPVTSSVAFSHDDVVLLCTDGLTRHVTDREIAEELRNLRTTEASCRALLDLALERGGEDNITIVLGCLRRDPAAAD